jgi:hypothetical protein
MPYLNTPFADLIRCLFCFWPCKRRTQCSSLLSSRNSDNRNLTYSKPISGGELPPLGTKT